MLHVCAILCIIISLCPVNQSALALLLSPRRNPTLSYSQPQLALFHHWKPQLISANPVHFAEVEPRAIAPSPNIAYAPTVSIYQRCDGSVFSSQLTTPQLHHSNRGYRAILDQDAHYHARLPMPLRPTTSLVHPATFHRGPLRANTRHCCPLRHV